MKRFLTLMLCVFCVFGLAINEAQAKRFGGGRSFGMQRSVNNFSRSYANPQAPLMQHANTNRWIAPLAGMAMGGILASLLMGHGIGSGILSWLAVAGVIYLLVSLVRGRQSMFAQQHNSAMYSQYVNARQYSGSQANNVYPLGFDAPSFLREAKAQFIRLQAAYDQKNMNDIRQFTSPSVLAEIHLQFQERGDAVNVTEVVSLDAELMDVAMEGHTQVASVKFSGLIREDNHPVSTMVKEVWHFEKSSAGTWLVAGVEQV